MQNLRETFQWLEEQVAEKQYFYRILKKYIMFGEIKEVTWLSKIPLSREREQKNSDCFINGKNDFKYPNTVDDFDGLLEFFKEKEHLVTKIIQEKI